MNINTRILLNDELKQSKEVVDRLVNENLNNKMASYLKKFNGEDVSNFIEIKLEKNKKSLFNGIVQANLDGESYRYEREDYKNLDDLINHLFDRFKESLSSK